MHKIKGQSALEYTILVIIILGAFVATSSYIKRGIQGRWKSSIDDLGDQYDPRYSDVDINYTLDSNQEMKIITLPAPGGVWTQRTDTSNALESKKGSSIISPY